MHNLFVKLGILSGAKIAVHGTSKKKTPTLVSEVGVPTSDADGRSVEKEKSAEAKTEAPREEPKVVEEKKTEPEVVSAEKASVEEKTSEIAPTEEKVPEPEKKKE